MLSVAMSGQEKTVNVNGSNYHVFVKGLENRKENDPVIIFESGMGVNLENWKNADASLFSYIAVSFYDD